MLGGRLGGLHCGPDSRDRGLAKGWCGRGRTAIGMRGERVDTDNRGQPRMTPLIGRAEELRRIGGRLEGARRSAGGCLVVSGEAGIGKTALLAASAEAAEGFAVLQTRGVESDAELPFTGMVELVR